MTDEKFHLKNHYFIIFFLLFFVSILSIDFLRVKIKRQALTKRDFFQEYHTQDMRAVLKELALKQKFSVNQHKKLKEIEKMSQDGSVEKLDIYDQLIFEYKWANLLAYLKRKKEALKHYQKTLTQLNQIIRNGKINQVEGRMEAEPVYRNLVMTYFQLATDDPQAVIKDNPNNPKIAGWDEKIIESVYIEKAIETINEWLLKDPFNLTARRLFNLAHMKKGTYPNSVPKDLLIDYPDQEEKRLEPSMDKTKPRGLEDYDFSGGILIEDFDKDGWLDIVGTSTQLGTGLVYLHNEKGKGFSDWTRKAGLEDLGGAFGLVSYDYDHDGYLDVFVIRGAWMGNDAIPHSLLHNNGDGTFADVMNKNDFAYVDSPFFAVMYANFARNGIVDLMLSKLSLRENKNLILGP